MLLKQAVDCEQVLGHAVALNVDASVLVVELLIACQEVLVLAPLNDNLLLDHAVAFCRY